MADFR